MKKVNVFIGRNNSGKSSLLESLYLASAAFYFNEALYRSNNKIEYLLNRRCDRRYSWRNAKDVLWYEYNFEHPIYIKLGLESNTVEINLFKWHIHPLIRYELSDYDYLCFVEERFFNSKSKMDEDLKIMELTHSKNSKNTKK